MGRKSEKNQPKKNSKKYFLANTDFILYPEIRALFLKAQLLIEGDLVEKLKRLSGISLIIFTGALAGGGGAEVRGRTCGSCGTDRALPYDASLALKSATDCARTGSTSAREQHHERTSAH